MLNRIFDSDNGFFRFLATFGYVWWLHILWLLCSIPVITIGASTTALCYSCMKLRRQEGYATRNFFHSLKQNFGQSTLLGLIMMAAGGVLCLDLLAAGRMEAFPGHVLRIGIVSLLLIYVCIALYVFAVQAVFVNSIPRTIRYSLALAGRHMGCTLKLLAVAGAVVFLNFSVVLFNYLTLSVGIGLAVYIMAGCWNRVFERYINTEKG